MKQLSIPKLLLFTFIPSLGMLICFLFFSITFKNILPPFLANLFGVILILVPFQLGIILYTSKKEHGKYNLKSALIYTQKISKIRFIISIIFSIIWTVIIFGLLQNIEHQLMFKTIFSFVPDYLKLSDFPNQLHLYSDIVLKITAILVLLLNGILAPIVEELFFRGYLMPRIDRFGKFVPLIITVLFSLYHFFSPWENITRIIGMYPYNYLVWKNKNIYIGIITHCFINIVSGIMVLILIF